MTTKKTESPGSLHSDSAHILLHTRAAVVLFMGRPRSDKKPEIFGLPRFSGAVNQIYRAAQADDPWADWWLVKIDEAIDRAEQKLAEYREKIESLKPANKNIKLTTPESQEPVQKPLDFGTPYPYRIAYLIVEYDELCSAAKGLAHTARMPKAQSEKIINLAGSPLRNALACAGGYRYQGVTRNDVLANNPKAQKARTLMGDVPDDILNMKKRSPFAPELVQYKTREDDAESASTPDTETSQEAPEPAPVKQVAAN